MAKDQRSDLVDQLKPLRQGAENALRDEDWLQSLPGVPVYASHDLALWLFLYHESSDVLVHSELLYPDGDRDISKSTIVKNLQILGGLGTIGFVLRTKEGVEAVADTFDDPRGTVAVQDTLLGNFSWCGIRIDDIEGNSIGIVSFFPASRKLSDHVEWSAVHVPFIRERLKKFVRERHNQFVIICQLALAGEANGLLTKSFKPSLTSSFQSKVATTLGRVLTLGSPFGKLPVVTYLEKRKASRGELPDEYDCRDSSFLRLNSKRLRLDRLQYLQWEALTNLEKSIKVSAVIDQEYVETISIVLRRGSVDHGLILAVHVRREGTEAKNVVERFFEPWRILFEAIYRSYCLLPPSDKSNLRRRKVLSEAVALVFGELSRVLLLDQHDAGELGSAKAEISLFFGGLIQLLCREPGPYIVGSEQAVLLDFAARIKENLNSVDLFKKNFYLVREQVIGLSLWHQLEEWVIVNGFDQETELKKLKASGNWRVFQRAASLGDEEPFMHFRPIDWESIRDWKVSGTQERTISWDDGKYSVTFSPRDVFFPLDLQICDIGFAAHRLGRLGGLLSFSPDKSDPRNYLQCLSGDERIKGLYEVLASDEEEIAERVRIIAAGPLTSSEEAVNTQSTLKEFSQKELQVLLLSEYARQVTKESHRAGITAIMARNASHNLGSHVLARHSVRNIGPAPETEDTDLIMRFDYLESELKDSQVLDRYLQGRMDLLAQISTNWPKWTEPAHLVGEILWGFLAQKILLQEIVASEGFGALEWEWEGSKYLGRSDGKNGGISINCLIVPWEAWSRKDTYPAGIVSRAEDCEIVLLTRSASGSPVRHHLSVGLENDPLVAIPGGVTGWHSFYIVIENIIRNAAKHRKKGNFNGLGIVIEILGDRDRQLRIDGGVGEGLGRPAYLVRIYDDISLISLADDNLLEDVNNFLSESVIDKRDGSLRRENWGLAEMKVAAAYLQMRGIDSLEVRSHSNDKSEQVTGNLNESLADGEQGQVVIRAVRSPIGTLGYEFFLLSPQRLGITLGLSNFTEWRKRCLRLQL